MVNMVENSRQTSSTKMSKCNWTNELVNDLDAGLHGQKTLTKFLMKNFDRVNGA
jgi:hypothetical protein